MPFDPEPVLILEESEEFKKAVAVSQEKTHATLRRVLRRGFSDSEKVLAEDSQKRS